MTTVEIVIALLVAFAVGVMIGWAIWGMPIMFAKQRGEELDADGYTICKKEIAEAGRNAFERKLERWPPPSAEPREAAERNVLEHKPGPTDGTCALSANESLQPGSASALLAELAVLRDAVQYIEAWKLPYTGDVWPSGNPISFEVSQGSRGVRDYIRSVARNALATAELLRKGSSNGWLPIDSAPNKTEVLVGRWVNDVWHVCQSGHYYDPGFDLEGEPACWYWASDWDNAGVTENPEFWMPLPKAPRRTPARDDASDAAPALAITTGDTVTHDWTDQERRDARVAFERAFSDPSAVAQPTPIVAASPEHL